VGGVGPVRQDYGGAKPFDLPERGVADESGRTSLPGKYTRGLGADDAGGQSGVDSPTIRGRRGSHDRKKSRFKCAALVDPGMKC